jgi:hypothetical protein
MVAFRRLFHFVFTLASLQYIPQTYRPPFGPTQPLVQWVPGVKRPVPEADYSPPSSAEVKNCGAIPPLPIFLRGVMVT